MGEEDEDLGGEERGEDEPKFFFFSFSRLQGEGDKGGGEDFWVWGLWGEGRRKKGDKVSGFFFFFFFFKFRRFRFFRKKKNKKIYFCHVSQMWQPHQHLTDQWMENVTDVLF